MHYDSPGAGWRFRPSGSPTCYRPRRQIEEVPDAYEAQGAAATYRRAEAAIRKARCRTPAVYLDAFEGAITEFDGKYLWEWLMVRPMPMMVKVWKDGQWVTERQVWNETEQRYQTADAA